mmetsp:Transcript_5649/g.14056  ORF Transcript_5649/g.14056 Transcript_5649/m.14056 type:complete len:243 (-) Transcript_5649:764-1492(-)
MLLPRPRNATSARRCSTRCCCCNCQLQAALARLQACSVGSLTAPAAPCGWAAAQAPPSPARARTSAPTPEAAGGPRSAAGTAGSGGRAGTCPPACCCPPPAARCAWQTGCHSRRPQTRSSGRRCCHPPCQTRWCSAAAWLARGCPDHPRCPRGWLYAHCAQPGWQTAWPAAPPSSPAHAEAAQTRANQAGGWAEPAPAGVPGAVQGAPGCCSSLASSASQWHLWAGWAPRGWHPLGCCPSWS